MLHHFKHEQLLLARVPSRTLPLLVLPTSTLDKLEVILFS